MTTMGVLTVERLPRSLLHFEGLAVAVAALVIYFWASHPWWLILVLALAPGLAMAAYAAGPPYRYRRLRTPTSQTRSATRSVRGGVLRAGRVRRRLPAQARGAVTQPKSVGVGVSHSGSANAWARRTAVSRSAAWPPRSEPCVS
jgi:Domain of unknown function (DUF4260)